MSIGKMVNASKKGELAWWLDAHRRYFARQAAREGFELDDDILTVFDRFEVVEIEASRGNALGIEVDVRDDDPALCSLSDRFTRSTRSPRP
jgi:hypothetical protein